MGAEPHRPDSSAGRSLADLGLRIRFLRFLLLLASPRRAYRGTLLGGPRGASSERRVQPDHGSPPAVHGRFHHLDLLRADGALGRPGERVPAGGRGGTVLPILAAHAPYRAPRDPGSLDSDSLEPPRPSRAERPLPRQELRRRLRDLGSSFRQLPGG